MAIKQIDDYRRFCQPAELHKAVNSLRGLVGGITADGVLTAGETAELINWVSLHEGLRDLNPFNELLRIVDRALADGVLNQEEGDDILWLCQNIVDGGDFYDMVTSGIQQLEGIAHGMLADKKLTDGEVRNLNNWMNANDFLAGCYPFDEIYSLTTAILSDRVVTERERETLMAFLSNVVDFSTSANLSEKDFEALREKYSIQGICAACPEIQFRGKAFVFTGESERASRAEIAEKIEALGGVTRTNVSSATDYLIVGNAGNPCWAYACYGRKIEKAVTLRKNGARILIVNETDFWDAVEDSVLDF